MGLPANFAVITFWCTIVFMHTIVCGSKSSVRLPQSCSVPVFAETDVSETSFLFEVLLSELGKCGCHVDWRKREDYMKNYDANRKMRGPLILVATGGPSEHEQNSFKDIPKGQEIILLHPSDEGVSQTDTSIYGGIEIVLRNYFHSQMDERSMEYLLTVSANKTVSDTIKTLTHSPQLLWMPLGLANLKAVPDAFKWDFLERPHLWSWAGSTGSKPERSQMLHALESHNATSRLKALGVLQTFNSYAGRPIGSQGSMNNWEYTMLMQKTQFLPVPAGISAEQFRVWEAFEAGCIPIILRKHVTRDNVLYPLRYLGFRCILLESWDVLPDKLLQLHMELKQYPRQYSMMQEQNTRIWNRMKHALAHQIAAMVCKKRI